MQFLLTICFLVCKYPHVSNIINDVSITQTVGNPAKRDSERTEIQKVTYVPTRRRNKSNPLFEPLDTQAITLVSPNLFDQRRLHRIATLPLRGSSERSNDSVSSREESVSSSPLTRKSVCDSPSIVTKSKERCEDEKDLSANKIDEHLQNLRDLRLDDVDGNVYNDASYTTDNNLSFKSSKIPGKSKCLLLDALMSYLNSAVNQSILSFSTSLLSIYMPVVLSVVHKISNNRVMRFNRF